MKKALPYLSGQIILSLIIAAFLNNGFSEGYFTAVGLANLLLGVLGIVIAVIAALMKEDRIATALVTSSVLLILMGTLTCSIFPFRLNG